MEATSGGPPQKRLKACKVEILESAVTVLDRNSPTDTATASVKLRATTGNDLKHLSRGPLESMPWDIVVEILRLAHPKDLISWARTTKSFRAFLMNRRSMHIWKTSRQRVTPPAPDCPSELDEPQYAVLLFTSDCTVCGKPGKPGNMQTSWELLARYCGPCAAKDLFFYSDIWKFMMRHSLGPAAQNIWFCATHDHYSKYSRVQVTELEDSLRACTTKEEREQLLDGQIAKYQKRLDTAGMLESWTLEEERQRRIAVEKVRSERVENVLKRLREEGWGEELDKLTEQRMKGLCTLEAVDKAVPLTENAWKDMREDVTKFMEFLQICRLEDEWSCAVSKRLQWLQGTVDAHNLSSGGPCGESDLLAEFSDIALFPKLRTLLDKPSTDIVTEETLAKACQGAFPALQEAWMREHEQYFIGLVKQKMQASALPDSSMLSLAIVTFKCKRCLNQDMRWPYVLTHACGHPGLRYFPPHPSDDRKGLEYRDIVDFFCAQRTLRLTHSHEYEFEAQLASAAVEDVIRVCGYDPLTVSYAEMRDCKVRIYCTICVVPSVGFAQAFDWQNALHHSVPRCDTHGLGWGPLQIARSTKWAALDPEDTAMVLPLEDALRVSGSALSDGLYRCALCPYETRKSIWSHFRCVHKGKTPKIGKNFYIHPSSGNGKHYAIWVYPEYDRDDPTAAKDVENGSAIFSPRLFQ